MAKRYHPPTVVALESAFGVTHGLFRGTLSEHPPPSHPVWTRTTHSMIDI
jgi:hypothetical protein